MRTEYTKDMSLKIADLVENARAGNRSSFQELVNLFQEEIYRLIYFRTFSQMDAEDLTQDVFEQALKKLATLNDPQRFRSWLYAIAVNRCNDFHRKKKYMALLLRQSNREQELADTKYTDSNYDDGLDKKTFWKKVRSMLKKLSAMEREVFTLRFMDHRNINEIAAILGKNESTVKTHLYRALNKLRGQTELFREHRESIL